MLTLISAKGEAGSARMAEAAGGGQTTLGRLAPEVSPASDSLHERRLARLASLALKGGFTVRGGRED